MMDDWQRRDLFNAADKAEKSMADCCAVVQDYCPGDFRVMDKFLRVLRATERARVETHMEIARLYVEEVEEGEI